MLGKLGHGGALAAGDDESIDALQLRPLPNLHSLRPDLPQRCSCSCSCSETGRTNELLQFVRIIKKVFLLKF